MFCQGRYRNNGNMRLHRTGERFVRILHLGSTKPTNHILRVESPSPGCETRSASPQLVRGSCPCATTVEADEDYLYRSITDPQAQIRADWTIKMPTNSLSDDQVASIIAYIKELQ